MREMDSQNPPPDTRRDPLSTPPEPSAAPVRLVVEASLLSAFAFLPLGFYQPFFPLWLSGQQFDATTIGLLMALPTVLRVLSAPTL